MNRLISPIGIITLGPIYFIYLHSSTTDTHVIQHKKELFASVIHASETLAFRIAYTCISNVGLCKQLRRMCGDSIQHLGGLDTK